MGDLPERRRVYQDHHLDSTRWDALPARPGDIVISTSIKAGTTWTQRICSLLIHGPGDLGQPLWGLSPWIDQRFIEPIEAAVARAEAQDHRRFFKSHLPLDALPYRTDTRYIAVGRDTRDVAMSAWNHYSSYTEFAYTALDNAHPDGGPFPRAPGDIADFWRGYFTKATFAWEPDGWPFWSHHYHAESWWRYRHLPNVLVVHYNDLKADLGGEMRRIARFLDIEVGDDLWPALVDKAGFESMKADGRKLLPELDVGFRGGADAFLFKGTNQRWREEIAPDELALYDLSVASLDADLRAWLEGGRLVTGEP